MKLFFLLLLCFSSLFAGEKEIKVGVLAYGTVNWELMTIKSQGLDTKYGFNLVIQKLASKNGVAIAFQAGSADIIVNDWVWVNRQNAELNPLYFYPYSKATGALYTNHKEYKTILDLKGKKVGVAGGPIDKSWLLLRAYSMKLYGEDFSKEVENIFAAPPILNKKIIDGFLDGVLNFWHYNARLEKYGMNKIISINEILRELGVESKSIPFIGWVFKKSFAQENRTLIESFLQASYEAKQILNNEDKAWNSLRGEMHVKDDTTFEALKQGYRNGIPKKFTKDEIDDIQKIYSLLEKIGGKKLVGHTKQLDPAIFWQFNPQISW